MAVLNPAVGAAGAAGALWYCRVFLASLGLALLCVGVFDVAVDPYDMFATPRIAGFNARKPAAATHQMMTKTYAAERMRPVTVLLGSSRVDVGLDPASAAFPQTMRPVFNFGIGGQTYAGDMVALREAFAGGRLAYAFLVVDFELALKDEPALPEEQTARVRLTADLRPNLARQWPRARDWFLATLTLGALLDSLDTVLAQSDPTAADMAEDGASSDAELRAHTHADGAAALFAEKDRGDGARDALGAAYLAARPGPVPSLQGVAGIVGFCHAHDIALTLVIPPMHERALAQWRRFGVGDRFQAWKSQLTGIGAGVPVWDFSAPSAWTTEVPQTGQPPIWFWESLHFKRGLGELMLRRMLRGDATPFGNLVR